MLVSVGHHDLARIDVACRGFQSPTGRLPVDAVDFGAQPQLDPAFTGVPFEVGDDVVAGREHRGPLRVRPVRQVRERPAGVQFQSVVATSPRRSHVVAPFDQQGRQPAVTQAQRHRDTRRTCSDDLRQCSVISGSNDRRARDVQRARGCAPAQTSRSACTVTMV